MSESLLELPFFTYFTNVQNVLRNASINVLIVVRIVLMIANATALMWTAVAVETWLEGYWLAAGD